MNNKPFLTLEYQNARTALAAQAVMSAVIAAYPLLEALRTCYVQTCPGSAGGYGRAPFNVMGHSDHRWTDRDRDIVTPCNDLLYSNAWLDLRNGPVVIHVPAQTGRFFVVQLLDVWTNNFYNIDQRNTPIEGGRFALIGPGHDVSEAPPGCTPIFCPTKLVWLLGRVLVDSDADLPAARALQLSFTIDAPPLMGSAPISISDWQQGGDLALDFFANLARALADFPPPANQVGCFTLLASAHITLRPDGHLGDLRAATMEGIQQGFAAAMTIIDGNSRAASTAAWRYSTRLGRFGDDLMLRASTAFKGLGALSSDVAVYAMSDRDSDGIALTGQSDYRICFEDGGDLPADAFWSLTLYGADRYLAPNTLERFALGSRNQLVKSSDGSLTLLLSRTHSLGPHSNWLPTPDGSFYLILRLYHPQQRFFDGLYRFPQIERL